MSYKYALIDEDNIVQSAVMSPVPLHFHNENETWVDVPNKHLLPAIGWKYDPELGTFEDPKRDEDLDGVKEKARRGIEVAAGLARKKVMPDEYGQMELYREKYEQAIDFLCAQDVVQYSDYPLLEIEARILDIPMKNIAENIIKRRSEWISKLTQIEELRLYGKAHIGFCKDSREVELLVSHLSNKLLTL